MRDSPGRGKTAVLLLCRVGREDAKTQSVKFLLPSFLKVLIRDSWFSDSSVPGCL